MRLTISIMSAWVVGAFLALPASGVEVAADGFGQVLLYPYYTIRGSPNAFNTLISIGNSTPDVKAVRLRFHEAREGAPVGDFNIYLNAYAVWTGAVFATADGAGLASADHSCTRPIVSSDAVDPTPFNNASYLDSPDGGSLDRTREGYFEVIEMGDYGPLNTATPGSIAQAVSHDDDAQPIPANCALIAQDTGAQATAPTGGLFGSALLISVLGGVDYFYAATALSHYTDTRSGFGTPGPGTPSLADAQPPVSVVVDDMGRTIRSQWSRGIDAVSAALTSVKLQGEFVLDAGTKSGSEWVVTFPTKWYYIHAGALVAAPFQSDFLSGGECERILNLTSSGVLYDRESDFQPIPIGLGEPLTRGLLCFATQSVDFNASGVLGAATRYTSTRLPPMNCLLY